MNGTASQLDISGERRIEEILGNQANYVTPAIAFESLDGFASDTGLTPYPRRNIMRTPVVARAGLPSVIKHRFHEIYRGQVDHLGRRWLGVVVYDGADEASELELQLGGEGIGRLIPGRHDNRRHLLVLWDPVTIEPVIQVLLITARGTGSCRIENLVLMPERPEATSYAPAIDHLAARVVARSAGRTVVRVSCVTSHAAACEIRATATEPTGEILAISPAGKLHAADLSLAPDRRYRVEVTATEPGGATGQAHTSVDTGRRSSVTGGRERVPVEILNRSGGAGRPHLTFGVPLPEGAIAAPLHAPPWALLRAAGETSHTGADGAIPIQSRPLSRWPDGSVRWLLIDGTAPHALEAGSAAHAVVEVTDADTGARRQGAGLSVVEAAGAVVVTGPHARVTVRGERSAGFPLLVERPAAPSDEGGSNAESGAWQTVIGECEPGGDTPAMLAILGDGTHLHAGPAEGLRVESAGPLRAVVRFSLPHRDAAGTTHLRSSVRVHVYNDQPAVRVVHRLEVVSPALAPAMDGSPALLGRAAVAVRDAIDQGDGEEASLLTLRSLTLRLPRSGTAGVRHEGRRYEVRAGTVWRLVHEHDQAYRVETAHGTRTHAGRTAGHLRLDGSGGPVTVGVRCFWETCPKGLAIDPSAVTVELLPALSGDDLPGDEDAWHRLYFWHRDGRYRLKTGMALTSELLIGVPRSDEEAAEQLRWFEQPGLVRPSLDWFNHTKVWSPLAPKTGSPLPRYEAMVDRAYHAWCEDREIWRQYGFASFGDYYGENGGAWGNNEYDPAFTHYCEFLRGGEPGWAVLGAQAARHQCDVDTVNYSRDRSQIGSQHAHIAGHAGGFLPPFFRYKLAGSSAMVSHTWVEGAGLHYLLTGDEEVAESLHRTAAWLTRGLDHYDYTTVRECGWHLIHLCGLARMSDDPRYLNAAHLVFERVWERQEPGGGWVRQLQKGHCGCVPPRHRGEAGFMVGVLLSGLRRYHELTGDARAAQAIVGGARWLLRNTYDPETRRFRYTACPRSLPHHVRQIVDGLVYGCRLAPDPELRAVIDEALAQLGGPRDASAEYDRTALGKFYCTEARYVPTLLVHLRELEDAPA